MKNFDVKKSRKIQMLCGKFGKEIFWRFETSMHHFNTKKSDQKKALGLQLK